MQLFNVHAPNINKVYRKCFFIICSIKLLSSRCFFFTLNIYRYFETFTKAHRAIKKFILEKFCVIKVNSLWELFVLLILILNSHFYVQNNIFKNFLVSVTVKTVLHKIIGLISKPEIKYFNKVTFGRIQQQQHRPFF